MDSLSLMDLLSQTNEGGKCRNEAKTVFYRDHSEKFFITNFRAKKSEKLITIKESLLLGL